MVSTGKKSPLYLIFWQSQGPKLTFLGRRQLATEFFFLSCLVLSCLQLPYAKMWSPKIVNRILPSQWNTKRWKVLVINFPFPPTIKIKCTNANTLIYLYTENPGRTNRMPATYAVSCDCQIFQVNFIPSLVPDWKTAVWFFVLCSKRSLLLHAFCQDNRWIAMLLAPGHNRAALLVSVPWTISYM